MPAPTKTRPHKARDTAIGTTVPPAPYTTGTTAGATASTRNGVTAVTRNRVTNETEADDTAVTALQSYG